MSSLLKESPRPERHEPQWCRGFLIDDKPCGPLKLAQVDRTTFAMTSRIEYQGETGLEQVEGLSPQVLDQIRVLDPANHPDGEFLTDLASVPWPTRWFLGAYGEHTPAALIHDWLIPTPPDLPGMTDAYADRYLRFMLQHLGMRWLKRWIMWAAVALRTRFAVGGLRRVSVILWVILAFGGMAMFVAGVSGAGAGWVLGSLVLPFGAALLWEKQYGAGIIAAIAAPWLLPPTVLAVVGYSIYLAIEWTRAQIVRPSRGPHPETGTFRPEGV